MATLRDKLTKLFAELPDGDAHLEDLPNGHVSGLVVSSAFAGEDFEQRRKRIRQALDGALAAGRLNNQEILSVSTILCFTPTEWAESLSEA